MREDIPKGASAGFIVCSGSGKQPGKGILSRGCPLTWQETSIENPSVYYKGIVKQKLAPLRQRHNLACMLLFISEWEIEAKEGCHPGSHSMNTSGYAHA